MVTLSFPLHFRSYCASGQEIQQIWDMHTHERDARNSKTQTNRFGFSESRCNNGIPTVCTKIKFVTLNCELNQHITQLIDTRSMMPICSTGLLQDSPNMSHCLNSLFIIFIPCQTFSSCLAICDWPVTTALEPRPRPCPRQVLSYGNTIKSSHPQH